MSKKHLKRLNAPRSWPISRKETKWVTRQNPGPHKIEEAMPLSIITKNLLKYAKTTRDVKRILNSKDILVDKIPRIDLKFPVGIFDIIEIPKTKEHFILLINKKGKLFLKKIDEKKSEIKHLKIIGKKILKNNKLQLNFYNGNNMLFDNKDYKVGDTLLINLNDKKIIKHLKLEKGALVYLIKGKHVGSIGTLEKLSSSNNLKKDILELKIDNKIIKTLKDYAFVVDKDNIN